MMPVVAGVRETKRQILLYTLLLAPLAVVPAVIGMASWAYGAVAGALGLGFIALAVGIWRDPGDRCARRTFGYSILYLFLIFAALMADRALGL
jgi:protoheme IX farnesyltransferase